MTQKRQTTRRLFLACALASIEMLLAHAGGQGQETAEAARRQDQAREQWQKTDDILEALALGPGSRVADVGAGDGFMTVRLAGRVGGNGRVYAVDVSERQLERLKARVDAERLSNVEVVLGVKDDPKLPSGLDAILVVNAYHEFEQFEAMLGHFRRALRPDGRLVLVEPMAKSARGKSRADQAKAHRIAAEYAEAELRRAGYRIELLRDPFTTQADGTTNEWLIVARPEEAPIARLQQDCQPPSSRHFERQ